jgi:hypothetical protein
MPEKEDALGLGLGGGDEAEPTDEFETEIRAAFPAEDWTPDRVLALKEAIKICVRADQAGDYDDAPKPPPKKGGVDLALVFGEPKKKKA